LETRLKIRNGNVSIHKTNLWLLSARTNIEVPAEQSLKRPLAWHSLFVEPAVELPVRPEEQFPPQRTHNTANIKREQQFIVSWLIKRDIATAHTSTYVTE
jgi:hypothetical protein